MEYKWSVPLTILLPFTLALLGNYDEYSSWNVAAGSPMKACPRCDTYPTVPKTPGSPGASLTSQQCNCSEAVHIIGAGAHAATSSRTVTPLRLRPMQTRDFWTTSLLSPPLLSTSPMALVLPTSIGRSLGPRKLQLFSLMLPPKSPVSTSDFLSCELQFGVFILLAWS